MITCAFCDNDAAFRLSFTKKGESHTFGSHCLEYVCGEHALVPGDWFLIFDQIQVISVDDGVHYSQEERWMLTEFGLAGRPYPISQRK